MSGFTPGPWEVTEAGDAEYLIRMGTYLVRGGRKAPHHEISYAHGIFIDDDYPEAPDEYAEARANANLIAAAPDLLEALKEARGQVVALMLTCGHSPEAALQNVERLDAAIAKARGEA